MRGDDQQQDGMFSYISPNKRVPQEHPLRRIRSIVDRVLDQLSPRFNKLYAREVGRRSLPRSCRGPCCCSCCTQWDASTFSKNRERMLEGDIAEAFFQGVLGEARAGQLLSDELPRASDDGESERTGGEHTGDHGLRFGGVSCRAADGGTVARLRTSHVGSR